jgi:hypothetical protein
MGIDGRIILKCVLKKLIVRSWTRINWWHFVNTVMNLTFRKRRVTFCLTERLSSPEGPLYSMEQAVPGVCPERIKTVYSTFAYSRLLSALIARHGVLIRVINMCLHMWAIQKREVPILNTLAGDLVRFLLGRLEALVVFLRILWSFKTSASLWELEIWQTRAVINSGVVVSWTDASGNIHQGPVCRAAGSLRSGFPWERGLIGKCTNVQTLFSKWANGGSRGRQLVTEVRGPQVSTVSERTTSTQSPFPVFPSGRTQNLRHSELLS